MRPSDLRKILHNVGALAILQVTNAILPFILAPYLTRTIGISAYGVVAFGFAFVQLACLITDYGFGISGVYLISRRSQKKLINKVAGAIYFCKIALLIPVMLTIMVFPEINSNYTGYQNYFWLLAISVAMMTLQPIWFFQGLEKMKAVTIYTVITRLIYICLVISFVTDVEKLYLVALFYGLAQLMATALSLWLLWRLGYWPTWPGWKYTVVVFKSSTQFFWSRVAVASYGAGALFFLGSFAAPVQTAIYSVAEQFYRGALAIYSPITQALYPHMAKHRDVRLFVTIFKAAIVLAVLGIGLGLLLGEWLIGLVFGDGFVASYPVFVVFMLALAFAIPSILLGYPFLGAMGNNSAANKSVIYAGVIQLIALSVLYILDSISAVTVVGAVLLAEICVLIYRLVAAYPYMKKF